MKGKLYFHMDETSFSFSLNCRSILMKLLSHTYRLLYCWNTFVKRIMAFFTGQSFLSVLTIAFS